MYGISNCLLNGPFRHVWKFSRFDMGAKRDPNFFQWYLCRFWRYPSGFNINAKYEKGQITWSYLFIFKMYESHRNKALIMSLFFAHFAYSHCQTQSLQQQVSDTPIFTASTYAHHSRCFLQSDRLATAVACRRRRLRSSRQDTCHIINGWTYEF